MLHLLRALWNVLTVLLPLLLLLREHQQPTVARLISALWIVALVCTFWFWAGPGLLLGFGCSLAVAWQVAMQAVARRQGL